MLSVRSERDDALRILLVTSDKYPPFRPAAKVLFGGELVRRGHGVDWVLQAGSTDVAAGAVRVDGGTAHVAPTTDGESRVSRLKKYWLDFRNDLQVFRLLARGNYSLVQVKDKYIGALVAIIAAKRHGVPFFYWLAYPHAEASLYAARSNVARYRVFYLLRGALQKFLLYRIIMPAARHVFVQSEQMRRDVAAHGIPVSAMTPVPSSVSLREIDDAAGERVEKPADERWLLYLGTLLRERRLDFLIRVLAKTLPHAPNARLLLVGAGGMAEDEAMLRAEAERLGVLERVTITGWVPMQRAWAYVRAADVCLSPYRPVPILRSTSPTKLIEYMALSRPVVGNDHPEQSDVIRASGAGLVCAWDEQDFADAILRVLDRSDEAVEMGKAGRRYVERHRTQSVIAELVETRYRAELASRDERGGAAPVGRRAPPIAGRGAPE